MKTNPPSTPGKVPVIFWHSDPVLPDETIVLAGADFTGDTVVELRLTSGGKRSEVWTCLTPLQWSEISLKAVVPADWEPGIYACRARTGEAVSKTVYLNAPDVWWKQGDEGIDRVRQGGWLRLFGKCLALDGNASVSLQAEGEKETVALELETASCFDLRAKIPADLAPKKYKVLVSQSKSGKEGLCDAGMLEVLPVKPEPKAIINVVDFGADSTGFKDCTLPIVQAIERLSMIGGGVVYFPRGRYRIDSILLSGTWIKSPLYIPENITLRGEATHLVSLWWPDQEKALPTLIDGHNDFNVENLTIHTQGYHSAIITGTSNVRIRNVRIRANYFYMTVYSGGKHHDRAIEPPKRAHVGPAILLWGDNNQVTGCDILHLRNAFDIRSGRGNWIAHNTIRANSMHTFNGMNGMIFEHNEYTGNNMTAGGSNLAQHMGGSICRHVYYAHNRTTHIYGGDREAFTFDGHNGAYFGKVKNVKAERFELADLLQRQAGKGTTRDMHHMAVYIVDGRGAGQFRFLTSYDAEGHVTIDRAWDVDPDETSFLEIGGFNGQHIFVNNTAEDAGALIQLYPPNCQNIVAGNRGIRSSNINSMGYLGCYPNVSDQSKITRCEISWYNQFFDNEIVEGNTWGGGSTEIDSWIGGEASLFIHGNARYYQAAGIGFYAQQFHTPEWLAGALGEKTLRDRDIPISRFQIVRRHVILNNGYIRVRGVVSDVLIEHCKIANTERGVLIDMEVDFVAPKGVAEQTFDFTLKPTEQTPALPFLRPDAVLIRRNRFENVQTPYTGTAIHVAKIVD